MSENLSLNNKQSNFAFIRALVFSFGKPDSSWFKATVGDAIVMVFFPDDKSINRDMIQPGDTIYIAGMQKMEKHGSCAYKANCAPFILQIDSFKNACRYRQANKQQQIEKTTEELTPKVELQQDINIQVDTSMKFCGTVVGAENVRYVKSKKEKYAKRGRTCSMHAINEIIEIARKNES